MSDSGAQPNAAVPSQRRFRHRRLIALTFASVVVAAALGLAEGGLRLAGFGGYPPTFRAAGRLADGSTLIFTDPAGPASYFFANRSEGMALDTTALVSPKPAGTVRVMFVGESAAKGIPQPRPLRASSFLREMLADLWPDRRVEVINLGTPGIASFPVLGVMTESLEHEPDLVVAYLGNNEFYGAYGVSSLHTAGRSPAMIRVLRWFHSTAIAQGVNHLLASRSPARSKTLMEAMVGQSSIGPDDPARPAAARTLETFVGAMIERCARRGVPIVVCVPACIERALPPLGQPDLTGLSVEQQAALNEALGDAGSMLTAGDGPAAEGLIRRALGLEPRHAGARHLLGRALAAQGRDDEAAECFRLAVDLDPMPWRPPASSIAAIRRAARRRGAAVADLEEAFRKGSPGGSVGWELMDDHVHPTLAGQDLVARTIVTAMTGLPAPVRVEATAVERLPGWKEYARRLGASVYEEYGVAARMRVLGRISFFARASPEMSERNDAICRRIEAQAPPPIARQLRAWAEPHGDRLDRYPVSGMVGRAYLQMGQPAEAEPLLRFAAASVDPYGSWSLEFRALALSARAQAAGGLDDAGREEARRAIGEARFLIGSGRSRSGGAELWAGRLYLMLDEADAAIPILLAAHDKLTGLNRVNADEALVLAYRRTAQGERARAVIAEGLGGPQAEHYRGMGVP